MSLSQLGAVAFHPPCTRACSFLRASSYLVLLLKCASYMSSENSVMRRISSCTHAPPDDIATLGRHGRALPRWARAASSSEAYGGAPVCTGPRRRPGRGRPVSRSLCCSGSSPRSCERWWRCLSCRACCPPGPASTHDRGGHVPSAWLQGCRGHAR
eukprot:1191595-Prorocentrum_minimum.AAC.4